MSVDTLGLGREAFRRHAWSEALEAFAAAGRTADLTPDDLELEGEAAWWLGDPDTATDALERAFAAHLDAGETVAAARVALLLTYLSFRRLAGSVGASWQGRAERLLEREPESGVNAWLEITRAAGAHAQSDLPEAAAHIDRAIEIASAHQEADAHGLALSFKGSLQIAWGNWQDGLALIDEAAAAASSGKIGVRWASDIYCNTIAACRDVSDYRRAAQWIDEAERWMHRQSVGGYPGICRVHRAELKMLRGRWPEAEQEARHATEELELFRIMDGVGFAHYEVGEVRLRMGDLGAAADAFERAYEHGHDAQPGLALLQLAQGDLDEAARSIERALAPGEGGAAQADQARRARYLPARVEIALAQGDVETARLAATELEALAAQFDRPAFVGAALTARGAVELAAGDHAEAARIFDRAWRQWQEIELPYESATSRVLYGKALLAGGDVAAAHRDFRAARTIFERLGAARDLKAVTELLGDEAPAERAITRVSKTFMFTDIVTSTDLVGLIGDDAWEKLLRWHDRELRKAIAEHQGEEVQHTGDGFFVAFEHALDGVECAVDIQRRLVHHRQEHGFAPFVRIGLHTAEATSQAGDFSGRGVHIAARVGAAAGAAEILISEPVASAMGTSRFPTSTAREVHLKGVKEPMEVRTVDWSMPG